MDPITSPPVAVSPRHPELMRQAADLATELHLPLVPLDAGPPALRLVVGPADLVLTDLTPGAPNPVRVDFSSGALNHRRRFGGGRGQPLARAVGLKHGANPSVVDATPGLGRDAFVLACLGCRVTLVERSPVVYALLRDGLYRARMDPEVGAVVRERLELVWADARVYLATLPPARRPEVAYIDPMYPHRRKSALVKKAMRALRAVVGDDADAPELLAAALAVATRRVVVKRPAGAPSLVGPAPAAAIHAPGTRFDLYPRP